MLRRGWQVVLLLFATGCSAPSGPLWSVERSLLFHPRPHPSNANDASDLGFEDAWFEGSDGSRLHGWYAEAKNPRTIVLYNHGNAGNVAGRADVLRLFRDRLHTSILVYDYRGFGRSEDRQPHQAAILDDARAARRWLAKRAGVSERDIVLVGNSLGGGIAVDLATDGARGLILENTFTSMPDVACSHFPWLPARWLMNTQLDSRTKIVRYRCRMCRPASARSCWNNGRICFSARQPRLQKLQRPWVPRRLEP